MENKIFEKFENKIANNILLKNYTSIYVGGKAKYFIEIDKLDDLVKIIQLCINENIKFKVIGDGTNIFFSDDGYDGIIIHNLCSFIEKVFFYGMNDNYGMFVVGSGTKLSYFIDYMAEIGFDCSKLSGIPGTIGGAVCGNAGAYGVEMKDFVSAGSIIESNGNIKFITNKDFLFSYRNSIIKSNNFVILSLIVKIPKGDHSLIKKNIIKIIEIRNSKLPNNMPSIGSFFKNINLNGTKIPVGWLLDQVGAKNISYGEISTYSKHANIIVNKNKNGTSNEINIFVDILKQKVFNRYGILLEEEVEFIK